MFLFSSARLYGLIYMLSEKVKTQAVRARASAAAEHDQEQSAAPGVERDISPAGAPARRGQADLPAL